MKLLPILLLCLALPNLAPAQKPKPNADLKWDHMDLGPFQTGTVKVKDQITAKGLALKVGSGDDSGTVLFDTELLRWSAAWTGGFIRFPRTRGGLEGQIAPEGTVALSTGYAPGWMMGGGDPGVDPRERHQGHLPAEVAKWRGLYLHGDEVVLSYTVGATPVLELAGYERAGDVSRFSRTLRVEKTAATSTVLLCDLPGAAGNAQGSVLVLAEEGKSDPGETAAVMIGGIGLPEGAKMRMAADGRALLDLPKLEAPATFRIVFWSGFQAGAPKAADLLAASPLPDLAALTHGGPSHWGAAVESQGKLGSGEEAYVGDEIPFPESEPFGSWFRPGGHDFFPDGRAAVASLSGDVWIVSGLDEKLEHVRWQRFATGLFQPLGLRIVDNQIYVLGRDQITCLRDLNGDGEADFYECFNNDCIITENYHEFALDLQTDSAGNFYYAKGSPWQPTVMSPHQGCLMKVSRDGSKLEIVATGLRAPNGMGMGPHDEISVSDNQGHWMPSNRLNIIRPGGFYGMVPAAHRKLSFHTEQGDYQADPSDAKDQAEHKQQFWGNTQTPIPAEGYDLPLCWLPMPIDNSSGGEAWVPPGDRWGPLGGYMLQLSYGKCALFAVLPEVVDGVAQAALAKFPIKFSSGIMRARFSPHDGQLYLSGLRVWQTDAAKDGCFYRVRFTGQPVAMPMAQHATDKGLDLTFSCPLAPAAATPENFDVTEWNYLWTGAYGSPDVSVREPKNHTRDRLNVTGASLSADGKTISLAIEDFRPAMQVRVKYKLPAADGRSLDQEIYSTVHRVPGSSLSAP